MVGEIGYHEYHADKSVSLATAEIYLIDLLRRVSLLKEDAVAAAHRAYLRHEPQGEAPESLFQQGLHRLRYKGIVSFYRSGDKMYAAIKKWEM